MKIITLIWRQTVRNFAAGEVRILLAALILATMAVTSVAFLTDRAEQTFALESNRLLGGDAVLRADAPIAREFRALAVQTGVKHTETRSFPSMIRAQGNLRLGEIRAIGDGFPMRGSFRIQNESEGDEHVATTIPARGMVWLSRAGAETLTAEIGDQIYIGNAALTLAALIVQEPGAVLDYFSPGPKAVLNLEDLPATGLEQPGSRITYRLVIAGEPAAVKNFITAAQAQLKRGQRLETAADARPEIRSALDNAGRFLSLATLVSVILAAIALAMAARRHAARHLNSSAVMRCLGASQRTLVSIHVGELLILGLIGSTVGVALAFGTQALIAAWLANTLQVTLPAADWQPVAKGFGMGLTVLLAFAVPPVLALRRVSALRVLRRELEIAEPSAWLIALTGLGGLSLLLWWEAGSPTLGAAILLGIVSTLLILAMLALALIVLVRRFRSRLRGPWRYGLANVSRRASSSIAQISSLGLGLMVLLLLVFVRGDLLSRWQQTLAPDAPNRFIINVQPEQVEPVIDFIKAAGIIQPELYPMVRGRLTAVNENPISIDSYASARAQRWAEREFNLSFTHELPADNKIVAGQFWAANGGTAAELSVEAQFAQTLGWTLGDRISFDIAGQRLEARITSLRSVTWENFRPNFFVVASPGTLSGFPASYVGAVHVSDEKSTFSNQLVNQFPNLSVIDMDAILTQVRNTMEQVSTVVEAVFYFALAAGILVLLAAVNASQDERLLEGAIMRTLGGSRRQFLLAQISEFAIIGLLSGLTAAIAATILAGIIAQQLFDLPWSADLKLILVSAITGTLAAVNAGMLATRYVLDAPPSVTLRELQN